MENNFDFSGWATRNDLLCGDGRTIRKNAFKHCDGATVPLVWNHDHTNSEAVLGHALLENKDDGVYAYCTFNDTDSGKNAKALVEHGDVRSLSIYANKLKQIGKDVIHGTIRELSLVLAGANPGAYIDFVMAHGDDEGEALYACYDESALVVCHAAEKKEEKKEEKKGDDSVADMKETTKVSEEKSENSDKTIKDVLNDISNKVTKDEMDVIYGLVGMALSESSDEEDDEDEDDVEHSEGGYEGMKYNIFDEETKNNEAVDVLSHSDMEEIFSNAKKCGTLSEAVLQHGIEQIDYLFPDTKSIDAVPGFIKRDTTWVADVMNAVHHTPFSRVKSIFADITEADARAKGYIKGNLKAEEVFSLLKRETVPTTIYKKQKIDRDDMIDITDFDVVAWLKTEMRMMLDEEIARAILIGDGRSSSSNDKINEQNVRPIWTDEDGYTVKVAVNVTEATTDDEKAKAFIRSVIKSRKEYKGSGTPSMFLSEDMLTNCLLLEDVNGRVIYDSIDKLATALRVKKIVPVPVMENQTRTVGSKNHELAGIYVNLVDYNVGADKGGAVNLFDDFDIDYNQQKYLIETRISGALTKPFAAVAIEFVSDAP